MTFRNLTNVEETILKRSFNNWGIFEIFGTIKILIRTLVLDDINNDQNHTSTSGYSTNIEIAKSEKNIMRTEVFVRSIVKYDDILFKLNPVSIGLKIGTINNKKFSPGLNFAEFVVKHNKNMDYPHVFINTKAENLVVFGRDIMGSSILSFFKDIKENQQVIILNHNKEVLGLGKSRYSGSLIMQPNIITIDTIQDIGTYYLKSENRSSKSIDKNLNNLL
jgi:ribosome biogenesis protein Nip4